MVVVVLFSGTGFNKERASRSVRYRSRAACAALGGADQGRKQETGTAVMRQRIEEKRDR